MVSLSKIRDLFFPHSWGQGVLLAVILFLILSMTLVIDQQFELKYSVLLSASYLAISILILSLVIQGRKLKTHGVIVTPDEHEVRETKPSKPFAGQIDDGNVIDIVVKEENV